MHAFHLKQTKTEVLTTIYLYVLIEACTCMASGDPHYKTYDGQWIHYMGHCKYTLTRLLQDTECQFNVEVKNRGKPNKHVTWTKYVEVSIHGHIIRLGQGKTVRVCVTFVFSLFLLIPNLESST